MELLHAVPPLEWDFTFLQAYIYLEMSFFFHSFHLCFFMLHRYITRGFVCTLAWRPHWYWSFSFFSWTDKNVVELIVQSVTFEGSLFLLVFISYHFFFIFVIIFFLFLIIKMIGNRIDWVNSIRVRLREIWRSGYVWNEIFLLQCLYHFKLKIILIQTVKISVSVEILR